MNRQPVALAAVPTLDEIAEAVAVLAQAVGHGAAAGLPSLVGELARLMALASLRVNAAASSTLTSDPATEIEVLTTKRLSALWRMPETKIRDLCRRGILPAKKLGKDGNGKEWLILAAGLRDWMRSKNGLADQGNVTVPSSHDPERGSAYSKAARPYAVSVRRPARRPREDRDSVGVGRGRDERHDPAANPVVGREGRADGDGEA